MDFNNKKSLFPYFSQKLCQNEKNCPKISLTTDIKFIISQGIISFNLKNELFPKIV